VEQVLPGSKGGRERDGEELEEKGGNPNNVYTCK
jgi:hypothetical protein